ncbi:hypothetical protein SAMN02745166_03472 [Prosthecobacter debontii]|uniref:Uncharacterized protein n=1 Tax=Prosthecobacter debontii TaxID=48467 RepID=A0A1T4YKP8_9BACT|nr:hypothetical protein [Prosthecobacter debontii]SKB01825.1 hypothetical protein SAMN02745166_03472 [Prosthecobacter debontii]
MIHLITCTSKPLRLMAKIVFLLCITAGTGLADNTVKLQVAAKSDHDDPKDTTVPTEVQKRWLEISANAFHLEKPSAVRLEWTLFGDSLDADKVVKQDSGETVFDMKQGAVVDTRTKQVTFTFSRRHSVPEGSGKRHRYKVVEATGVRYHGWSVRAYIDGKIAGETYSSPNLKKHLNNP